MRLEIPAVLWLLLLLISVRLGRSELPPLHSCIFLFLNLQGLRFIFTTMEPLFIGPWFFTCIVGCYVLYLCWNKMSTKHPGANRFFDYGGVLPLLVFISLATIKIYISGALLFFIGVILKERGYLEVHREKNIYLAVLFSCFAVALRLLMRKMADGTVLYDYIVVPLTHVVIAVSLLLSVKWLFGRAPLLMNRITASNIMKHLDRISVYVYISHTMLFDGSLLSVFSWKMPVFLQVVALVILILLLGSVLMLIGEWISKKVEQAIRYLFI